MPYNNDIPKPPDRLKASQNDLRLNFNSVGTWVAIDHITFDAASGNQGKHNTVSMPNVVGGTPTAVADEVRLYAAADSGSVTQMYLLPDPAAAPAALQNTRNITGGTYNNTGECTLPSGIKLKWGRETTAANGLLNVPFAAAFSAIYTIQVSVAEQVGSDLRASDNAIRVYAFDTASFDAVGFTLAGLANPGTRGVVGFHWLAIGI